jgi:hypothetical protein
MKQNIGNFDRYLRIFIGLVLLAVGIYFKSGFIIIFAFFSFYEAFAGWCIFYQLIGRNTCPVKTNKPQKVPILAIFLKGIIILIGAIILNLIAVFLNFYNWYVLLLNPQKVLNSSGLDNLIFLFLVYPFALGILASLNLKSFLKNQ